MLARRFLWMVTILILLALLAALAFRLFGPELMRAALVPTVAFEEERATEGPRYSLAALWIARPGPMGNPSLWTPPGFAATDQPKASVFFVHPTSFLDRSRWNAPLDDQESQDLARLFVRSQASAFNNVGTVWAPKYRQATIGAFLTTKADATKALAFAYRDVAAAFDQFLDEAPEERPIILAGHSQGSLHLSRLLAERIAGTPIAKRIAAAYIVGWPLSIPVDLPDLGLPPCEQAAQPNCILAWQSFAEPADPEQVMHAYAASVGRNGQPRKGTPILCVNPISGNHRGAADKASNLGTLIPDADFSKAELHPGLVGARCDPQGLLLIGENPPAMPRYVLPGNNYHVFDYALFWANIRADAERRVDAYSGQRP